MLFSLQGKHSPGLRNCSLPERVPAILAAMNQPRVRLLLGLLLLGALAASVALNLFLFQRSRQYYVQLNGTRLDPIGVVYQDETWSQPLPRSQNTLTAVFYGDSRAVDWPAPDIPGLRVVNRALRGQTTEQALQRYGRHVAPLQPDIVLIQVGINDLKTMPLFPHIKSDIVSRCKANIDALVAAATAHRALVIVTPIFPVGDPPLERRIFWSEEIATAVSDVNAHLASLAAENVLVLDVEPLLADPDGMLRADLRFDELHLNAAGYDALNAALVALLSPLIERGR